MFKKYGTTEWKYYCDAGSNTYIYGSKIKEKIFQSN